MTRARGAARFALAPIALVMAACTPQVVKDAAPPIGKTIGKLDEPKQEQLPIITSEPIAPDADKALENYRELLKLEQADPDTKAEATRRLADLQVQIQDTKGGTPEGETALKESIKLYNELLHARPEDKNNDRVFYQLARAYQNAGETDAAIDSLRRLTERHPDSEMVGDARFRRADLLFIRARYPEAETEFRNVMDLGDKTPFFEHAQYKYGWTLFKQSKFEPAMETFIAILDRDLPPGEQSETETALKGVDPGKVDVAKDALRVINLSLAQLGGGKALSDFLSRKGDPRFYPLLYASLGEMLLEKRRYTDSAEAYRAFIERYPRSARAPAFQSRVIAALGEGGFRDLVVKEKEVYAVAYDPAAPYWAGQAPTQEVLTELRRHLEDLGKHYQARAQQQKSQPDFLVAAKWYKRIIEVYPKDPKLPEINLLLGDALLDGGRTLEAAAEYTRTAYDYPPHTKSGEAAYAAVQAYQKHAKEVAPAERPVALRQAIDSGIRLADKFPGHPQLYPVLTQSSQDLFELKAYDEAITVAGRVIKAGPTVAAPLRKVAWSVTADSHFAQKRFPDAETAYLEELKLTAPDSPERTEIIEQVAVSIYRQGEAARDAKDLRAAANQFLRVGQVTPTAKIRATADYDGAAMLIALEDWANAAKVLESFRGMFPTNSLIPDVDKKLAVVYQKDGKPALAAGAYRRIAQRQSETPDVRREAAWLSATLFDEAKDNVEAARSYEYYVTSFPRPLARAMDARERLLAFARLRSDLPGVQRWLRDIVAAHDSAGPEASDRTRALAARSSLELGRMSAAEFRTFRLTLPIERSLPAKKRAMETAIQSLTKAGAYGFADVTTAATYELGQIYADFGKALIESERPANLKALELEQYNVLIEEQAFPFEEKAIETHESNLKRIAQGVYDEWVARSARALAQIAPARYGKREQGEERYESLK